MRGSAISPAKFISSFLLSALAIAGVAFAAASGDAARVAAVVAPTTDFSKAEKFEVNAGGAATSHELVNTSVFSQPSANMSFERQLDFKVGDGIFRKLWVSAPSSTRSSDGLGPLYNARSCQSCHLKDGRGHPPAGASAEEAASAMFLRLSIPPQTAAQEAALAAYKQSVIAEPTYGTQLQDRSVQGLPAEGRMQVDYTEEEVVLTGGETASLRRPTYSAVDLNYGDLHPQAMLSPRLAPPMIGMGLLEAIATADILAGADPDDRDGDGISGRPNWAWSEEYGKRMLGRFGWKAGEPTVAQQSANAFAGDVGIASLLASRFAGDCTEAQPACLAAPDGRDSVHGVEVVPEMMAKLVFYSRNLAVPARRSVDDPQVLEGKQLFYESGCTGCHRPKFVTQRQTEGPEQSFQLIWPYTDLLLHDMGDGLADGRPEGAADGREWRTAPLWGVGLTEQVSGHTFLLHDGRARNLLEAILWHGGEAQAARDRVVQMTREQRAALLAFLNSL
jgi:CxxC motif-containing protein (DUF1111 family)